MDTLLTLPRLADCRRLFLRNFEANTNIGVYDFEKTAEQRVRINVDVFVPLAVCTPRHDKLSEVLDYDFIHDVLRASLTDAHIHLLETLCDRIADALLAHEHIRAARVAVEKPDLYPSADTVGVEVFRIKEA